jgi:hypothetical protein
VTMSAVRRRRLPITVHTIVTTRGPMVSLIAFRLVPDGVHTP